MRRVVTFVVVAAATAFGLLYWLHDGDVHGAAKEASAAVKWNADGLASDAGVPVSAPKTSPVDAAPPADGPTPEDPPVTP